MNEYSALLRFFFQVLQTTLTTTTTEDRQLEFSNTDEKLTLPLIDVKGCVKFSHQYPESYRAHDVIAAILKVHFMHVNQHAICLPKL